MRSPAFLSALHVLVSGALALGAMQACASISESKGGPSGAASLSDGGHTILQLDGSPADALVPADGGRAVNRLCGTVGRCGDGKVPDDADACREFDGDAQIPPRHPDAGVVRHDGGADGRGAPDASADGSLGADGGPRDAAADAPDHDGGGGSSGTTPPSVDSGRRRDPLGWLDAKAPYTATPEVDGGSRFSCQVRAVDNGAPIRECAPAGRGNIDDPCSAGSNCRAGLACVASGTATTSTGQCEPYCCLSDTCGPVPHPDGGSIPTFCTERQLIEGYGTATLTVPVCVPAVHCGLDEPYPCPPGKVCTCPPDNACAVVDNSTGTTGCVTPGKGRLGEACPCAAGYFCSAAKTCFKLCKPSLTADSCHPGKCQAAAGLPDGWGLCEGPAPAVR